MIVRRNTFFAYLAYAIMVINHCLILNIYQPMFVYVKMLTVVLFIISIVHIKWYSRDIINVAAISILLVIVFYNNRDTDMLYYGVVILASQFANIKQIAKIDLIFRGIAYVLTISLFCIGVIDETIMYRFTESGTLVRHSLGFIHPNHLLINYFVICIDVYILKYEKIRIMHALLLTLPLFVINYYCDSRTGTILFVITTLLILLSKEFDLLSNKIVHLSILCLTPLLFLFSIISIHFYKVGNLFILLINELISGRIRSSTYYWTTYGVSLFGQKIDTVSSFLAQQTSQQALILDNLYIKLPISWGIIITVLYLLMNIRLMKLLIDERNICLIIVISMIAIYGLMESIPISVSTNITVMLFGRILYSRKEKVDIMVKKQFDGYKI